MSDSDFKPGLEGVIAFESQIAEPDKEGGSLRYRGVDIEDLVGAVPYEQVWGLLVDGRFKPGLPPAEPHPLTVRSGDPRVDVQEGLAMLTPEQRAAYDQLQAANMAAAQANAAAAAAPAPAAPPPSAAPPPPAAPPPAAPSSGTGDTT